MSKRIVTFREVTGSNFRLLTGDEYRDFEGGVLSTDDDDPYLPFLEQWAANKPNIEVTVTGERVKAGVMTCPVCGMQVGGQAELDAHNEEAHVQPESKGQKTTRRRKG